MNLQQVEAVLRKIQMNMDGLKDHGDIINEFDYDRADPEACFKAENIRQVLEQLGDIRWTLEWLQKPIVAEGVLVKNENGRYEIEGTGVEFSSGRPLDVWHYDDWDEKYVWTRSRVEHGNGDYYIVALGKDVSIEGLKVRTR